MRIYFPPAFDINYYRNSYPELNGKSDEIVKEHYRRYAEERGYTVCPYDRSEYLRVMVNKLIKENPVKVLEIGPYDNPSLVGENVKYFDIYDSETLKELAEKTNRPVKKTPAKIHYVEPNGDLSIVNEKFDMVFSSHCIEHQPNLLKHLKNVEKILVEGGLYVLVIPDKRYCLAHFRNDTNLFDVLDAAVENRTLHTFKSVSENRYGFAHNNPILHWLGEHGSIKFGVKEFTGALNDYKKSVVDGEYIDTHAWCFTPKNFGEIITGLNELGMIHLEVDRLCHTIWGRLEFIAILRKNSER